MIPLQIYNALIEYMTIASFTPVHKDHAKPANGEGHSLASLNFNMRSGQSQYDFFKTGSTNTDEMFVFVIKAMVAKRNATKSHKKARKTRAAGFTEFVRPQSKSVPGRQKGKGRKRSSRAVSRSPLSFNST